MTTPGQSDPQQWIVGYVLFSARREQNSAYSSDHSELSLAFPLISPSPLTVALCVSVCVCVCSCSQIINTSSGSRSKTQISEELAANTPHPHIGCNTSHKKNPERGFHPTCPVTGVSVHVMCCVRRGRHQSRCHSQSVLWPKRP